MLHERLGRGLAGVLRRQDGLVSRSQLLRGGLDANDIEVLLRSPSLHHVCRGVYRTHTGEPTWRQQVWTATLRYAPAAAAGRTCLCLLGLAAEPPRVEVAVDASRRVAEGSGIVVRRTRAFARAALLDAHPPRMRLEHAVLDVAADLDDERRLVAHLTEVLRTRRTTPARLRSELDVRARFPHRALILALLKDAEDGVQSVLEHRYLHDVERAHGLPAGRRQARAVLTGGTVYRDVEYLGGRLLVELDGRQGHEATYDRWADAARDAAALVDGAQTLRLTYGQVLEPCRTAVLVARMLAALGWEGRPRRCSPACMAPSTWRVAG